MVTIKAIDGLWITINGSDPTINGWHKKLFYTNH